MFTPCKCRAEKVYAQIFLRLFSFFARSFYKKTYFCRQLDVTFTKNDMEVYLKDSELRTAAEGGMASFLARVTRAIEDAAGGNLTADVMQQLNSQQTTLWAFDILREEVGEGGFIQLIHNGYGPFFFQNHFARAIKEWGLRDLAKMMYDARKLYLEHGEALTKDMTDEEFMALYEQYPDFEPLDDDFVEKEDGFVEMAACYVDEHLEDFIQIENE